MVTDTDVLTFWFGAGYAPAQCTRDQHRRWFGKDEAQDRLMAAEYGSLVHNVLSEVPEGWGDTLAAELAQIIVLDQWTRNIHRGTSQMYAGDVRGFRLARDLVATGNHEKLAPVERLFIYLPFEHQEDLSVVEESVVLFRRLEECVSLQHREPFSRFTLWADKHREVVERFGRYPHRNELLGRTSTQDELAFLETPGSRF